MRHEHEELLRRLALNDEAALEDVLGVPLGGDGVPGLDPRTRALVRLAALVALDADPASYQWAVADALAAGAGDEEVLGVLVALAPVAGLVRVGAAAPQVALAIGHDLDLPMGREPDLPPGR
ncbi:MAG TPA: carboxymuconolactone decarboxylase family protein [Acidimicrobiales bacterium]|jgi:4-carboxymuconolactone decarboxylase